MKSRQQGFSYLVALFMVAILSVLSLRAMENVRTKERREKEAQLLFVGQAYRNAIREYYENTSGTAKRYPPDLESLLIDIRANRMRRPLRKLYRDPITSSTTWGVVWGEADGVMGVTGVYSLSTQEPIKIGGFPVDLRSFTGAKHYHEWQFVYQPFSGQAPSES